MRRAYNTHDFLVRLFKPPAELNRDVRSILSTATQAVACGGKHIATFTITHADRNSISMSCIVPVLQTMRTQPGSSVSINRRVDPTPVESGSHTPQSDTCPRNR